MKEKRYRPKPARRVYIPNPDRTRRSLGIPSGEDKIVQMGIKSRGHPYLRKEVMISI